ncbi:MAG: serine/threonine-protein kinase [Sandaracinaceae bacterium]
MGRSLALGEGHVPRIESRLDVFDVGDTLGDYRLVSRLNQGGMATLFLGQRLDAAPGDPPVAIKVIHEIYSDDWQFVRMFIDEALISVRIRHPNVVRVEELGEKDDRYYLVMEYVHGCSLAQLLRVLGKQGRRMRPEIAVWIASQVAAGLHAAHEMTGEDGELLNVIHRDVSPQNILLSIDGRAKLLDFGIAKAAGRAERTEAGVIKGKIRYMAPEQARGADLDRRVDVYALAVVLWETLTMRRFIEGKSELELIRKVRDPEALPPSFRAKGIDPRIDEAVLAGLTANRDQRPATAAIFQHLLEAAVPVGTVAQAHVAELLRVFMAEEIGRSAAAIPPPIAAALGEGSDDIRTLPGEDEGTARSMTMEERSRVLTMPEASARTDESLEPPPPPRTSRAISSPPPPRARHATLPQPSPRRRDALLLRGGGRGAPWKAAGESSSSSSSGCAQTPAQGRSAPPPTPAPMAPPPRGHRRPRPPRRCPCWRRCRCPPPRPRAHADAVGPRARAGREGDPHRARLGRPPRRAHARRLRDRSRRRDGMGPPPLRHSLAREGVGGGRKRGRSLSRFGRGASRSARG